MALSVLLRASLWLVVSVHLLSGCAGEGGERYKREPSSIGNRAFESDLEELEARKTYVWAKVRDKGTGQRYNFVLRKKTLRDFMLEDRDRGDYEKELALVGRYANRSFVIGLDADVQGLRKYLAREATPGHEKLLKDRTEFEHPLSFRDLGVSGSSELLDTFFYYHNASRCHLPTMRISDTLRSNTPALIALLIDSGYTVKRGDYWPALFVCRAEPASADARSSSPAIPR